MKVFECDRCGKEIIRSKASELEEIKCSHCNKEFIVDKKTKRNAMFVVAFFVLVVSFVISAISQLFNIALIIMLIPTLILGFFAYRWALWVLAKFNKLNYTSK